MTGPCQVGPGGVGVWGAMLFSAAIATGCGDADESPSPAPAAVTDTEGCPATCATAATAPEPAGATWECEAEPLCGPIGFSAPPGFGIGSVDSVGSVELAHCALEAMRDGRVGVIVWSAGARMSPGVGERHT